MPQNPFRAHFDPLNEINGTYKRNFLELLVKIVNYGALKGLQSRFWPATLYNIFFQTAFIDIFMGTSLAYSVRLITYCIVDRQDGRGQTPQLQRFVL